MIAWKGNKKKCRIRTIDGNYVRVYEYGNSFSFVFSYFPYFEYFNSELIRLNSNDFCFTVIKISLN